MENTTVKPYCTYTETRYQLKAGTKGAYQQTEQHKGEYTEHEYNNCVEAAPFFRRLGGSEHLDYCYTRHGYKVYRIISKSPDKQIKVVREFNHD